ncbi:phosphoglucosamine mutase [Castellaniella daejeonensis]|jgi:phosphoglucosamine mutase|uniref:Phosphoglucosamine mutase n=1 Tax=Castellaniella daejeonensis TaxID=659013 RepID=A0ABP3DJQ0_9BURK|nr:phosphoglucosamine mutase [Castellaniella sp.]HET8704084.1 phosphoglucosamine mutase [Castellaniella sp.]
MSARKYFGTDGVRGIVGGDRINAEFALRLGYAAGRVLARGAVSAGRPTVVIGKDTRISGYMLESALEAGLSAAGVDVMLAGPIPTPAVAYLTRAWRLAAGIVISASHNPHYDNGIKFFSGAGTKLPDETEEAIEALLDEPLGCADSAGLGRARRINDAAGRYIEFCKSTFPSELDLQGLKVVVDAANGAAYHIAPHVFRELGADVSVIGCEPDGFNINENVGATHPETLVAAVAAQGADLGIALDGDADRLQMVDASGRLFNGDELLYAIVRDRARTQPIQGVVGTLMTNFGFERRMRELGIPFERAKVGDRYVLEVLRQRGWLYGGESSGHLLCLDRHTTGDGIVAALQVLAAMRHADASLAELVSDLSMYAQKMVNVPLAPGLDWQTHAGLKEASDAVRASLGDRGRVLIRASGTEPKLRLMVEADDEALAEEGVRRLVAVRLA